MVADKWGWKKGLLVCAVLSAFCFLLNILFLFLENLTKKFPKLNKLENENINEKGIEIKDEDENEKLLEKQENNENRIENEEIKKKENEEKYTILQQIKFCLKNFPFILIFLLSFFYYSAFLSFGSIFVFFNFFLIFLIFF